MKERFRLEWREDSGLRWLEWEGAGAAAAFPTRQGGVSPAPFESLNLGLAVGDRRENVLENRRRWCRALGLRLDRLVVPAQVHGTRLEDVGEQDAGSGALAQGEAIAETDALTTGTPGLGLAISSADCVPVVIVARAGADRAELATVHAGWRGMLAGIVSQAAGALARRGRLLGAVVGPSIGPCRFVVDDGLRARFESRFPGSAGTTTVDLWRCARQELEAAGVPPSAVTVTGLCTASDARFFSHRRDHATTGRHLAVAWVQERPSRPAKHRREGGTT